MENKKLPDDFKPLFWSQDYLKLDLIKDKKTIIVNTINYGDISHWKWIKNFYGEEEIRKTLMGLPHTELRVRVLPLAQLIFSIPHFNYAPRGTN